MSLSHRLTLLKNTPVLARLNQGRNLVLKRSFIHGPSDIALQIAAIIVMAIAVFGMGYLSSEAAMVANFKHIVLFKWLSVELFSISAGGLALMAARKWHALERFKASRNWLMVGAIAQFTVAIALQAIGYQVFQLSLLNSSDLTAYYMFGLLAIGQVFFAMNLITVFNATHHSIRNSSYMDGFIGHLQPKNFFRWRNLRNYWIIAFCSSVYLVIMQLVWLR